MSNDSSPGPLGLVAQCLELLDKQVSMLALNFNDAVFKRAACSTLAFELFGEFLQTFGIFGQAGNQGDALAFSAFGFSGYAYMPIAERRLRIVAA